MMRPQNRTTQIFTYKLLGYSITNPTLTCRRSPMAFSVSGLISYYLHMGKHVELIVSSIRGQYHLTLLQTFQQPKTSSHQSILYLHVFVCAYGEKYPGIHSPNDTQAMYPNHLRKLWMFIVIRTHLGILHTQHIFTCHPPTHITQHWMRVSHLNCY